MRRKLFTVSMLLFCLLSASPANAQFVADDDRQAFIWLSTTTSTAVTVGVIMLTVANVRKDPTALQRYLRHNEPAVRAAMSLGGGAVIADLAAFFGLAPPHHEAFAALLRRHRNALARAAYDERDVAKFADVVWTAISFDRRLARR